MLARWVITLLGVAVLSAGVTASAGRLALPAETRLAASLPTAVPEPPTPTAEPLPTATPEPSRGPAGWQRGFAFWGRLDSFGSPESFDSLRRLRDLGATTVSPVITWYVAHPHDPHLHPGPGTPSDEGLVAVVDEAHRLGLRVVLTFHVNCEDGTWRARIDPPDKERWFAAYGGVLNRYAELAEAHGVDGMVIGTELIGVSGPAHTARWRAMIAEVRQRFSGFLTYSAEWGGAPPDSPTDPLREFEQVGFWQDLDYLGLSAYFELANDGRPSPSLQELLARWEEWRRLRVEPFQARHGMPLLFTEVGYRSADSAARHPWDGGLSGSANLQLQADLYEALFQSWAGVPWFQGGYFWFWPVDAETGDPAGLDYPPTGKPAEQVLRRWYGALDDMEQPSLRPPGGDGTILAREGG